MGHLVYILCAVTSIGCTALLIGRYRRSRVKLLFWSALAFFFFTITNILLFVDLAILPKTVDLMILRNLSTLAGVIVLLYALIHDNT
jgi:hypothetical protein